MTVDAVSLTGQVVLVGYGRVGRRIARRAGAHGMPFVVAEQNRELVERLRARGIPRCSGDAIRAGGADPGAHRASRACWSSRRRTRSTCARWSRSPARSTRRSRSCVRTHSEEEARAAREARTPGKVFIGEHELAMAMTRPRARDSCGDAGLNAGTRADATVLPTRTARPRNRSSLRGGPNRHVAG